MGSELFNLLFELSNEDRFNILLELQHKPKRISHVAKKLNLTRQETSRNFSRLSDAQLVHRDVNGFYQVTSYGKQILRLIPGFNFLSQHKNYFSNHTLSFLPTDFFSRIGELENCLFVEDALKTIDTCETLINQSNKYIWFITHQYSITLIPYLQHALEREVKIRIIMPSDLPPPSGYFEHEFVQDFLKIHKSAVRSDLYEERKISKLNICLGVADNNQGRIVFPNLEGNFDYKGFTINDKQSHMFCKDLFMYYWNNSK